MAPPLFVSSMVSTVLTRSPASCFASDCETVHMRVGPADRRGSFQWAFPEERYHDPPCWRPDVIRRRKCPKKSHKSPVHLWRFMGNTLAVSGNTPPVCHLCARCFYKQPICFQKLPAPFYKPPGCFERCPGNYERPALLPWRVWAR